MQQTDLNIAWAAGLFEGEGTIFAKADKYKYVGLGLSSTDEDVVKRFHQTLGIGKIYGPKIHSGLGDKPMWQWQCQKESEVNSALEKLLPFLGDRRKERAKQLLEARQEAKKLNRPYYFEITEG